MPIVSSTGEWDIFTNTATFGPGLLPVDTTLNASLVAPPVEPLTYYVRFTLYSGTTAPFDGSTLYQLSGFSFEDAQTLSLSSTGTGAGKVTFDPLQLSFTQASLTPQLLQYLARGAAFKEIDVLGYDANGNLAQDYSFGLVGASDLTIGSGSTTTAAFGYGSESIQTYSTDSAGLTTLAQSGAWNLVRNVSGFSAGAGSTAPAAVSMKLDASLVAPPVDTSTVTYYVRFTTSGTTAPFDGKTLYQLSSFSFEGAQTLAIGSQSSGTGAGKVTFDPLKLSFTQASLAPQLFQYLAHGAAFNEVDVLGYDGNGNLARDYSFGFAAASDLTIGSGSTTTAAFNYGSESIQTYSTDSSGVTTLSQSSAWNRVLNVSGFSTGTGSNTSPAAASTKLDAKLVASPVDTSELTYYVRFTLYSGTTAPFDGSTLYQLSGFSFEDAQTLSLSSTGTGAGKVTFDPLKLSFDQASLTPKLLQYLASGAAFKEIDVLGYVANGNLAQDYSFGLVGASDLTIGSGSTTTAAFGYGSESIQTYSTDSAGLTTLAQSGAWNLVRNVSGFSAGAGSTAPAPVSMKLDAGLVAPPVDTSTVTYYVRFTTSGTTAPFDGKTLYQLSSFSFEGAQTLAIGSQSSGTGAGKVTFDPLKLSFTQASLTPQLLQFLAQGAAFNEVDVLGYDGNGNLARDYSFGFAAASDLTIGSGLTATAAFNYGSESIQTYSTDSSGVTTLSQSSAWNRVLNVSGFSTGTGSNTSPAAASTKLDAKLVASPVDTSELTYYVRFTLYSGTTAPFDGSTLYQLSGFSFEDAQILSLSSTGTGAGKVTFDPLKLSFDQASLTPKLLQYLASGAAFKEIDVLGYDANGNLAQDYSFGLVGASDLTIGSGSTATAAFGYGSESIQTYSTDSAGLTTLAQSAAWNLVRNVSGFSAGAGSTAPAAVSMKLDASLVAPPVDTSTVTYYVRFTTSGTTAPFDGKTLYQLSSFSFEGAQTLAIGSQSSGTGAGKVTFDPLKLSFTQASLTPQLFQYLAQGTAFKEVDVLGYDASGNLAQRYSFGDVAGSDLAAGSTSDSIVSLAYGSEAITTYSLPCFCAGALILTERGKVAVENLLIGDLVITTDGDVRPICWIGRRKVMTRFADPLRCWPIRIKAGALDVNVPDRDLLISPDHALLVDNVLINAGALVNGTSIIRETVVAATFVYYHVELDDHSLILADNAPAETFVDNIDRMGFDNWAEHEALYPRGKPIDELPFARAKAHRQVPMRIRAALDARADVICLEKVSLVA